MYPQSQKLGWHNSFFHLVQKNFPSGTWPILPEILGVMRSCHTAPILLEVHTKNQCSLKHIILQLRVSMQVGFQPLHPNEGQGFPGVEFF